MIGLSTDGFYGGGKAGGGGVAPVIAVVSPTPGVAPGSPGGFPKSYRLAKDTPIILDITAISLEYAVVIARFYRDAEDPHPIEEVVYRRGQFRGLYVPSSSASTPSSDVLRLTALRFGGWPGRDNGNYVAHIVFAIDALDTAGDLDA